MTFSTIRIPPTPYSKYLSQIFPSSVKHPPKKLYVFCWYSVCNGMIVWWTWPRWFCVSIWRIVSFIIINFSVTAACLPRFSEWLEWSEWWANGFLVVLCTILADFFVPIFCSRYSMEIFTKILKKNCMTRKKHPPILTVRSEHFVHDPFPAGIIYYKGDSRWLIPGWEATRQGCSTTSNHVPDKRTPPPCLP